MTDNSFVWTDELVKEFMDKYNNISGWITGIDPRGDKMKIFKQSKLAPPPVKDRIEVNISGDGMAGLATFIKPINRELSIPQDKFPAIKLLIERFLNNEFRIHADQTWSVHSENQKTFTEKDTAAPNEDTVVGSKCVCTIQVGMVIEHMTNEGWCKKGERVSVEWFDMDKNNVYTSDKQNWSTAGFLENIDTGKFKVIYYPQPLPEKTSLAEKLRGRYEPQPTAADTGKEWEILTCFDNPDVEYNPKGWHPYVSVADGTRISNCEVKKCIIRSVKRLSDGAVFSVKDIDSVWGEIIGFKLDGNYLFGICNDGKENPIHLSIYDLQHAPIPAPKAHVTWAVQKGTFDILDTIHELDKPDQWWTFPTKDDAEKFVKENKPQEQFNTVTDNSDVACLSLNDCSKWYEAWYPNNPMKEAFLFGLSQIVKQKLKQ